MTKLSYVTFCIRVYASQSAMYWCKQLKYGRATGADRFGVVFGN